MLLVHCHSTLLACHCQIANQPCTTHRLGWSGMQQKRQQAAASPLMYSTQCGMHYIGRHRRQCQATHVSNQQAAPQLPWRGKHLNCGCSRMLRPLLQHRQRLATQMQQEPSMHSQMHQACPQWMS